MIVLLCFTWRLQPKVCKACNRAEFATPLQQNLKVQRCVQIVSLMCGLEKTALDCVVRPTGKLVPYLLALAVWG